MERRIMSGIILVLLLAGISTLASNVLIAIASPEDTTVPYVFSKTATYTYSTNDGYPEQPHTTPFSESYNITFGPPDANGVINLTVVMESYDCTPAYDSIGNYTWQLNMTSDGYGKLYTLNGTGDVDIKSMTNDTGTYFWKDEAWHPAGGEWIGDGILDPANSSWLYLPLNATVWEGEGVGGPLIAIFSIDFWLTTGFSENTIVEPASRLDGFYMNETGEPFNFTDNGGIVTYVTTQARLNIPYRDGIFDLQYEAVRSGSPPPVFMATLFSPANLYVTDPENRHVGTDPTTGEAVNEILGAFYSGPESEPQRIIIPDPLDGDYDIEIIGTSTGTYTLVIELATLTKRTTHIYSGNIVPEAILKSEATVSEGEITSATPVSTSGDVNVDGIVDILDVVTAALAFGSRLGDPNWDPRADLNNDGLIDIFDLVTIGINYGKTW